jgi:multiple sugar transport system ATP-binding protein
MAKLRISGVSKRFGAHHVLKDMDITVDDGDFLVLVGPSGCGKSTLLSIIAGLETHTSGTIEIDGKPVMDLPPKARDIAMVFQSYALYPAMNVEQNIGFSLEMAGVAATERRRRIADVADLLQISDLLKRKPAQLSGGQRQRVAMGRALVRNPKIFLFDEPLSNLDAKLRVDMRTEIKKLHQRLKATIVYVTHDQIEAMTMANKIAVMKDGVVQQFGPPEEIYERPANTFVATFMGSPQMNLLPGRAGRGIVMIEGCDIALQIPPGTVQPEPGAKVLLGIRPEDVVLSASNSMARQTLSMIVEVVEPTGPDILVELRLNQHRLMARLPAGAPVKAGAVASFDINLAKAVLFDEVSGRAFEQSAAPAVVALSGAA